MSFTSDDVNLMIHRYLQESGYRHSLFVFQKETRVTKSQAVRLADDVKPGALVHTLQKGLQMLILEAHLGEDGPDLECRAPFSILVPHLHKCDQPLSTRSKRRKRNSLDMDVAVERRTVSVAASTSGGADTSLGRHMGIAKEKERAMAKQRERARRQEREREKERERDREREREKERERETEKGRMEAARKADRASAGSSRNAADEDADVMANGDAPLSPALSDAAASGKDTARKDGDVKRADVLVLRGHQKEVFACAWNPVDPTELASGSGDATGRLWRIPRNLSSGKEEDLCVLHHLPAFDDTRDVTTMEWNSSGTLLASGTYDGQVRLWTSMTNTDSPDASPGALRHVLQGHQGPIFAVRWNKKGDLLLSAGVDGNVFVWDAKTGTAVQQFLVHKGPVMDADWRDDSMFASASSDNDVAVCQLGRKGAVRYFKGHKGEVNTVRWDPSGSYLASCSDDGTAKVWTMDSDEPMATLSHGREVYSLRWKPVESGSGATLATASFDHVVRLWEIPSGELVRPLAGHADTVYALEFDRGGRRLATGGLDGGLAVWDVETGAMLTRRYAGASGSVFSIGWNVGGDRVAAAASDHTIIVLEVPS